MSEWKKFSEQLPSHEETIWIFNPEEYCKPYVYWANRGTWYGSEKYKNAIWCLAECPEVPQEHKTL